MLPVTQPMTEIYELADTRWHLTCLTRLSETNQNITCEFQGPEILHLVSSKSSILEHKEVEISKLLTTSMMYKVLILHFLDQYENNLQHKYKLRYTHSYFCTKTTYSLKLLPLSECIKKLKNPEMLKY